MGVFTDLRLTSFDTFQALFPRVTLEDDPVIVIDIDDESLNRLGQWPWSRNALASLTDKTQLSAVTGFDIVFIVIVLKTKDYTKIYSYHHSF